MDTPKSLLIYESDAMKAIKEQVLSIVDMDCPILIRGETGVGKTDFASDIHSWSKRSNAKFIKMMCTYKSAELFRNELFGHVKGAYTSADSTQEGKMKLANNGTLFFDEIGDLPLETQADLLEVIGDQRRKKYITPVGSTEQFPVDVRIIAATNVNLEKLIKEGKFREDLYYRFDSVIEIPPLRKRELDMYHIFDSMKSSLNIEFDKKVEYLSYDDEKRIFDLVREYKWPGNIRDFLRFLRAVFRNVSSNQSYIFLYDVEKALSEIKSKNLHLSEESSNVKTGRAFETTSLKDYIEEQEREYIKHALIKNQWHCINTAKYLKISRNKLYRKVKYHKIEPTFF